MSIAKGRVSAFVLGIAVLMGSPHVLAQSISREICEELAGEARARPEKQLAELDKHIAFAKQIMPDVDQATTRDMDNFAAELKTRLPSLNGFKKYLAETKNLTPEEHNSELRYYLQKRVFDRQYLMDFAEAVKKAAIASTPVGSKPIITPMNQGESLHFRRDLTIPGEKSMNVMGSGEITPLLNKQGKAFMRVQISYYPELRYFQTPKQEVRIIDLETGQLVDSAPNPSEINPDREAKAMTEKFPLGKWLEFVDTTTRGALQEQLDRALNNMPAGCRSLLSRPIVDTTGGGAAK